MHVEDIGDKDTFFSVRIHDVGSMFEDMTKSMPVLAKLYPHFKAAYTCDETKAKNKPLSSISISFC